jgi:hypothetical protein
MIDLPDHDCFAGTEPRSALWRRVVFSFLTGFVVVSIVGVGIVRGWWS